MDLYLCAHLFSHYLGSYRPEEEEKCKAGRPPSPRFLRLFQPILHLIREPFWTIHGPLHPSWAYPPALSCITCPQISRTPAMDQTHPRHRRPYYVVGNGAHPRFLYSMISLSGFARTMYERAFPSRITVPSAPSRPCSQTKAFPSFTRATNAEQGMTGHRIVCTSSNKGPSEKGRRGR